jgi:hypothetical protein
MKNGSPNSANSGRLNRVVPSVIALLSMLSLSGLAQQPSQVQPPVVDSKQQRHQQLLADAAKLLELANELKAEVDKSSKDTLSVPVVKKADEVGKLAKKLREEMRP